MRPQYVNAFSIMKNGNGTEVTITFSQQYAEQINNQVIQKMDDISSVVLTPEVALNLIEVLNKVVGVEYPPSK